MYLTDSTTAPFSDKLMIQRILAVGAETVSTCSDAVGSSFRSDLGTEFSKLLVELGGYAKDSIDIMIKHGCSKSRCT